MFASWNALQPEISDLIVQHEPRSTSRLPVRKEDVLATFRSFSNTKALNTLKDFPTDSQGFLDPVFVDRLLIRVHWEMQRLAEEFYHGARVLELLQPLVQSMRETGFCGPLRVVDVGCGIGYVTRWLAARSSLPNQEVELIGVDLNGALVREANRLARVESLPCRFVHGDAFSAELGGHIYLSTGVVHHFRGQSLHDFFDWHRRGNAYAFLHYDFHPWLLAPVGSWFFHILRMRTQVARHDGVLSAARAHSANTLLSACRKALPEMQSAVYGARVWGTPVPRIFQTIVGAHPNIIPPWKRNMGRRARRLEGLE